MHKVPVHFAVDLVVETKTLGEEIAEKIYLDIVNDQNFKQMTIDSITKSINDLKIMNLLKKEKTQKKDCVIVNFEDLKDREIV